MELDGQFRLEVICAGEVETGQFREPFDVEYVPGAMMFSRLALMRKVGGFRKDFFMYIDDVELCLRFTKLGYPITMVPAARATHFDPLDSADSPDLSFHKLKNLGALYLLHAVPLVWPEFILRYFVVAPVREGLAGRGNGSAYVRALLWLTVNAPKLLVGRLARYVADFDLTKCLLLRRISHRK